ncbi:MAG TPA: glutathione binding-like protein [Reyranella sp.]|nr:glutathione binding-like protein [Reyranella sp.]
MRQTTWLAGNAFSIADIAVVPFIKRIDEEIAPDEMQPARHPRVAEWWAKVQARPAFARAGIESFPDELAKR